MKRHRIVFVLTVAMALAGLAGPGEAEAAEPVDARWTPWLGCWQLWEEQFEQAEQLEYDDSIVGRTSVCVTPADEGITLRAMLGDELLVERHLVADGVQRDVVEESCRGWERSSWSSDGRRLFTHAEMTCDDQPTRTVTGVSMMASTSSWVDLQYVTFGEREQIELRRYSPMPEVQNDSLLGPEALPFTGAEIRRARREAARAPSLDAVMEASERTAPRVVEAMLVETEPDLDLQASSLVALDEAGIDHGVIDLMVALSYPERFVVERRDRGGAWSSSLSQGIGGFGGAYDPIWYSDLYPYYVTPLGSRYWGRGYNPYLYGAAASPFVVIPTASGESTSPARAYAGRGYTRVRPRDPQVSGQVQRRGTTVGRGGSGRRRGASGGGGGTATSGGFTDGGGGSTSGGGGGRRAVPRSR